MDTRTSVIKARWYPGEGSSIYPTHGDHFEGTAVLDEQGYAVFYYLGSCSAIVRISELRDEEDNPIEEV